ncbi:MFS transporter [Egicoccus sp. AB-alg6-2]|uniref:MFS transporter n=1 Tax=Egicoccus sp. AB-alg6-2 TaxID=3242692 RepID=UPI00359E720C
MSRHRAVSAALVSTAQGMLPVYMLGGLSVQMGAELGFGTRELGLATTIYFAVSAVGSAPAGRFVQRSGAYRGIVATAALSGLALLGIAGLATSWTTLVGMLVVAGIGNAFAQPAANLLLASEVPSGSQGLFFGIKQSAVPITTLLAGVSVPLVGLTIGWRWAFVMVAAGSVALPLLAPRSASRSRPRGRGRSDPSAPAATVDRLPLAVLAAGAMLGAAAANSIGVFLVSSAVDAGFADSTAGYLLAMGSVLGIVTRVIVGALADRREGAHVNRVAAMLVAGSLGFALLAVATPAILFLVGTVIAFVAGWGWNGLFTFAVVRSYPHAAATATGLTQTGLWLGGMIGPLVFGTVAAATTFAVAWSVAGGVMLTAAAVCMLGRRMILQAKSVAANLEPS